MKIEISDDIAESIGFSETELLEYLAVCLYKSKKINGVQGGKITGTSEVEFHGFLRKYGEYVNYGINEYLEDTAYECRHPNH